MEYYINSESGVQGYELGIYTITVFFWTGSIYTYTYSSCGVDAVETMKMLAIQGSGLNTFINQNKPGYESKYMPPKVVRTSSFYGV